MTDTDGVGVWPNVSSWIRAESRSRSCSTVSSPSLSLLDHADYNTRVSLIDSYYNKIMSCINDASLGSIPTRLVGSKYVVRGWKDKCERQT